MGLLWRKRLQRATGQRSCRVRARLLHCARWCASQLQGRFNLGPAPCPLALHPQTARYVHTTMCDPIREDIMRTRREFFTDVVGAMAGIVFVGCGLKEAAAQGPPAGSTAQ